MIAGIDVGFNDRWEYLLVGDPMNHVAIAESDAEKGDIVLCPEAHSIIHPAGRINYVLKNLHFYLHLKYFTQTNLIEV